MNLDHTHAKYGRKSSFIPAKSGESSPHTEGILNIGHRAMAALRYIPTHVGYICNINIAGTSPHMWDTHM